MAFPRQEILQVTQNRFISAKNITADYILAK